MRMSPDLRHHEHVRVLVVEDQKVLANRIAEGLRDHFKGLLKANERSWTGQGGP